MSADFGRDAETRVALITGAEQGDRSRHRACTRPRRRRFDHHLPLPRRRSVRCRRSGLRAQPHGGGTAARHRRRQVVRRFRRRCHRHLRDTWGRDTFDYLINNAGMQDHGIVRRRHRGRLRQHRRRAPQGRLLPHPEARCRCWPTAARSSTSPAGRPASTRRSGSSTERSKVLFEVFTRYLAQELARAGSPSTRSLRGRRRPTSATASCVTARQLQEIITSVTALGRYGRTSPVRSRHSSATAIAG